jgi:hypothetical protein
MAAEERGVASDAVIVELEALLAAARRNAAELRDLLTVVSRHLDRCQDGERSQ